MELAVTEAGGETVFVEKLTSESFVWFGDVIEAGESPRLINEGLCERHHDLARLDFDPSGRPGVSLFDARIRSLPYEFSLLERHPLGSQTFLPLGAETLLVIAADGRGRVPGTPRAFESSPGQGVNLRRGVWHGVLAPLSGRGLFAVVDWIGDDPNLEIFRFPVSLRAVRRRSVPRAEYP